MKSQVLAAVAAACVSAAVANAQGQSVSYFQEGSTGFAIIDPVPSGGVVLTDFVRVTEEC